MRPLVDHDRPVGCTAARQERELPAASGTEITGAADAPSRQWRSVECLQHGLVRLGDSWAGLIRTRLRDPSQSSIACYADPACTRLTASAGSDCRTLDCRRSPPGGTSRGFACCNPRPCCCRLCWSMHTKGLRKRSLKARRISKGSIRKSEVGVSASSFCSLGKLARIDAGLL